MIDGVVYYTAAIEDVHQDAKLLFRKPEWMYFHCGGFNGHEDQIKIYLGSKKK